MISLILKIK